MKTRYELEYPIEFGGQKITALDIARPNAGIMKAFDMSKLDNNMLVNVISKIASVPDSDLPMTIKLVDMIDFPSDITNIGELIASWFPRPKGNQ